MTRPDEDQGRSQRVDRLRADWRTGETRRGGADADEQSNADHRREDEALESNDRIREEAPDDLETRRAADQLEREIKRSRDPRNPQRPA